MTIRFRAVVVIATAYFLVAQAVFAADPFHAGEDGNGNHPCAGLVRVGDVLYGVTEGGAGGFWGYGTIFKLNTDGSNFEVLHRFPRLREGTPPKNDDGAFPKAGLVRSGFLLFGTTPEGGSSGCGTVFKIDLDGGGFQVLHHFFSEGGLNNSEGSRPMAGVVASRDNLYGICQRGGGNEGTIFKIKTDGSGYATLHTFTKLVGSHLTNSDGAFSESKLSVNGNWLYGLGWSGGENGRGTLFRLATVGSEFQVLHHFGMAKNNNHGHDENIDGAWPDGELIASGDWVYGTASQGGVHGNGTLYKLKPDGSAFSVLHEFSEAPANINLDGSHPGGLLISGNTIFGTAANHGQVSCGTVFRIDIDGSNFETLHHFGGDEGGSARPSLLLHGDMLYGTTAFGGAAAGGTLYRLKTDGTDFKVLHSFKATSLPPSLTD